MNQENKKPWCFCETPEEKCTMNYCDENGCQNRKRHLVEENKLPTAEEILKQEVLNVTNGMEYEHNVTHKGIIKAMEEHTRLHTSPLQARIEELEKLMKENERLENIISGYTSSLKDYDVERKHLINENQKLREALDSIIDEVHITRHDWGENMENIDRIAKEALKGGKNE